MTLKSIPYPIRWRSQLDSTRCTELFATSTSSDRKSTRLNSSHSQISYAVFCLKKKKHENFFSIPVDLHYRILIERRGRGFVWIGDCPVVLHGETSHVTEHQLSYGIQARLIVPT